MVRGCQKKIVYLKSTGSDVFDEAYFVVRDGVLSNFGECDMIKEANRILDECVSLDSKGSRGQIFLGILKKTVVPFLIGAMIGMITVMLIK